MLLIPWVIAAGMAHTGVGLLVKPHSELHEQAFEYWQHKLAMLTQPERFPL